MMKRLIPSSVSICEVGPRDGFQMETGFIPTDRKIEAINALVGTGISQIQVTSFAAPKAIPQLRDAEEVVRGVTRHAGVVFSALVPNEVGASRAIAAGVDRVDAVVSVSDSHSLSNTKMTSAEALERSGNVARLCRDAGVNATLGLATALGCPFEGIPPYERVESFCARAVEEFGYQHIVLADTVGMADPIVIHTTVAALRQRFPSVVLALHLHNTRNMGLANVLAGMEAGGTKFDSSVAGIGGCPYPPSSTGHIATQDLLPMFVQIP